ncbi:MAG: hypothetical protein CM1200mP2_09040 [Planctomycetaceae bacterium]|nr:MAG: hypothetical protein CM1200mP2_09040 [Planctomycetaceae bacterium]
MTDSRRGPEFSSVVLLSMIVSERACFRSSDHWLDWRARKSERVQLRVDVTRARRSASDTSTNTT